MPKAVVLLVVAVVVGVALLQVDHRPSPALQHTAAVTTPTEPGSKSGPTTTTTTTVAVKPSTRVKVLVANGGTVNGAAAFFTGKLAKLGWGTLTATTTTGAVPSSVVYYAAGDQGAAAAIGASLGLAATVVQPLASSVPVSDVTGANVVLVVGPDLASQVTAPSGS
ncbi:MAG: LytR C-terminal domain-containing protein [Acidimicrobiales bacterium]